MVHFRFGLKGSDVQVKFRILFCSIYLFSIRIVNKFSFSVYFFPGLLYIVELVLTVLKHQSGSGSATIINNKVRFSVVWLSGQMMLTGKFTFVLFPFYPNQCIFSGGHP